MSLTVTQNINKLHITAVQNNQVVKLQPIINTVSPDFIETDPIFQASEASLFVTGDKANLDNQSGINSGDETTLSIQTKRPIKTVNGESLEGNGNVQIDYNDLDNLPTIPSIDNLVPYTGATQNVDLGEFELKTGQVEFDTTPTGNAGVGILRWNDSDGTLDLGLKGGNVTLQVGQEQVVRVVNKTGSNLLYSNYQAVRVNGAQGQRLKVALAQATNDLLSAETIGLVTENIDNNQEGFVTISGLIRGINTTGSLQGETWADGDMLYLSPFVAGRITNIKPSAPNHLIVVGYIVYAHANNGSIFVKVDNGYELEELHNVTETNYTTPIDTDSVLTFDVTNLLWKRLSWVNIKSKLKSYFDTFYLSLSIFNDFVTDVFDSLDNKLDKSSTPSSVYTTDAQGLQVMKPISEFQPAGDYVTVNTTQTVDGNKTFNDVGLIKKNPTYFPPFQSGGSFAIGGTSGYDSFDFYSFDGYDGGGLGSTQIVSNAEEGNFIGHTSLNNQISSILNINQYNTFIRSNYNGQRSTLHVDGKNEKIKIEGSQNKFAALGTSLITGTEYFEFPNQSGTLALLSDLTDTQNALNLKLPIESPSTTGTVISFTVDKVYGTLTTPETGNITADVTNAKLGVTNIIIHNSGTAPTFGSEFKKLSGSGNYVTGVVNYIYCTYISTTEIIYSINQRA